MTVSPSELRPADLLILYYLFCYGQGSARTIAETIDRRRNYASRRITELTAHDCIERVEHDHGPVTLTPAGLQLIRECQDTHILPEQRAKIEAAMPFTVEWD